MLKTFNDFLKTFVKNSFEILIVENKSLNKFQNYFLFASLKQTLI